MPDLGITAIGHVALKVADLDRSLAFYRDTLGFDEIMRLFHEDGSTWLVYLRITDAQFIELFPDGQGERAPDRDATAINHLCLETDDLDATAAALTAKGVALTVAPKMGADNNRQCWIEDPDGNRIEFMQMGADSMQRAAIRRRNLSR